MSGGWGRNDSVGIVDKQTGQTGSLRIGDKTADGWRLVSVNFDEETATFDKEGRAYVARLEQGDSPQVPPSPPNVAPPAQQTAAASAPLVAGTEEDEPDLSLPFSNRTFRVESGEEYSLKGVDRSPEVVEVRTSQERFALRRTIAESILRLDNMTPDDRLWMMVSYPGLIPLNPGEDAVELSAEAEQQLAEIINNPPTNTPSLEELNRLKENFVEPPPPPETP